MNPTEGLLLPELPAGASIPRDSREPAWWTTARLLEVLSAALHVEGDPQAVAAAVRGAERDVSGALPDAWALRFARAAGVVGLRLQPRRLSLAEMRASPACAPLVLRCAGGGALAILSIRGGRAHVHRGGDRPRWERLEALAASVGAGDAETPLRCWGVEAAAPLAPLRLGTHGSGPSARRRLLALIAAERRDILVVVAFGIGAGLLALGVPVAVQALVNTVAFGALVQPVVVLTILLLGCLVFAAAMRGLQIWVAELLQRRLFVRLALDVAHRIPRVDARGYEAGFGAEHVNRFFDVLTVQKTGVGLLLDGLAIVLQTVIGMVLLGAYHPALLGFDLLLLAAVAVILFGLGRGAAGTSIKESKAKYAVAAWLEELARAPSAFRSTAGAAFAVDRADELARTWLQARGKHFGILLRQILGSLALQAVGSSLLLGIGGWLVIQRQLSLGQLVAAELVLTMVLAGLAKLGKHLESYYDLLAAVDKLGQLVDVPLERASGGPLPAAAPGAPLGLRFREVSFGYGSRRLLSRFSLVVPPGGRLALRGPNGVGKSTFVDLVYGLRTPEAGAIELDGADLRDVALDELRAVVALVRGVDVFEATVADNVRMGDPAIDAQRIREALEAVGLLHDVLQLPQGLQTPLSASGAPLSAGQLRRLVIARAIACRPRLLLLDDALDGVDLDAREVVLDALFAQDAPWTIVAATQAPDVVERCNQVVELAAHQAGAGASEVRS